jgi:hypothetical protein
LLLENVPGEQEMEIIMQRISNAMLEPLNVNGNQLLMMPKIGVCMCQMTCGAFDVPNTVEIARCYGCAMSKGINRESEKLRVDA